MERSTLPNKSACPADPKLFRIKALSGYHPHDPFELEQVHRPDQMELSKKCLLFVHGAQYTDEFDTVKHLVKPYIEQSGLTAQEILKSHHLYFLSWDSEFISRKVYSKTQAKQLWRTAMLGVFGREKPWAGHLADVKRRAREASRYLEPFFLKITGANHGILPEIVTHSLGSFLVSDMVQRLAEKNCLPKNVGTWLSLQPAVDEKAFTSQGDFSLVPSVYSHAGARKEIWLSKFDVVLNILYPMVTQTKPFGVDQDHVPNQWVVRDLTWEIREAHGHISFAPTISNFFSRVSRPLQERFKQLALQPTQVLGYHKDIASLA